MNFIPKLRRAGEHDAHDVADVYLRSRSASIPMIPPCVHSDDEVRGWIASVVIPHQETWVAETELGEIVAMMSLDNGWIDQLYIDPQWTGQGIGAHLVQLAKVQSPGGLQLWTFQSNLGAQRFYERHGFVEAERTDGRNNEEQAPDIRFQWTHL